LELEELPLVQEEIKEKPKMEEKSEVIIDFPNGIDAVQSTKDNTTFLANHPLKR
jgi:hypothetical protein